MTNTALEAIASSERQNWRHQCICMICTNRDDRCDPAIVPNVETSKAHPKQDPGTNNLQDSISFYDVLTTGKPSYLSSLLTIQPARSTRSSKLTILYRPAVQSYYPEPVLQILGSHMRNSLPAEHRCFKDSGSPGTNL